MYFLDSLEREFYQSTWLLRYKIQSFLIYKPFCTRIDAWVV